MIAAEYAAYFFNVFKIALFLSRDSLAPADITTALIYNPKLAQVSLFASVCMPTINKRPITCYHVGTDYKEPLKM